MRIIKDNKKIKYLYHYTKNENVDSIMSSKEIKSTDPYIFFTDSLNKSIDLFEREMMTNNYYYDLDGCLRRREPANKEDYKIIKIPYYNDDNFYKFIFAGNNDKKNVYNISRIHKGTLHFDKAEVISFPIEYKSNFIFVKQSFITNVIALLLYLIPLSVKADTWLDDPSYRNTSWFNPDTYNNTTEYVLDNKKKIAGLLYLVNVKNYTFSGKTIYMQYRMYGGCGETECVFDMRDHEWVPLKSHFNGYIKSVAGTNSLICGYHRIALYSINKIIPFIEGDATCRFDGNGRITQNVTGNCSLPIYYIGYEIHKEKVINGDIITSEISNSNEDVTIELYPDDGYYLKHLIVRDKDGVGVSLTKLQEDVYRFTMPESEVYITAIFSNTYNDIEYDSQSVNWTYNSNSLTPSRYCRVITGNGQRIGDEIACGQEHFYVLTNNGKEVRMLAKYNLYTGNIINRYKIEKEEGDTRTDQQYCQDLARSKAGNVRSDGYYDSPGYCFIETTINSTPLMGDGEIEIDEQITTQEEASRICGQHIKEYNEEHFDYNKKAYYIGTGGNPTTGKTTCRYYIIGRYTQREEAIGAHWDADGNYAYPQVGDVNFIYTSGTSYDGTDYIKEALNADKYDDYFFDVQMNLGTNRNNLASYLINYYSELSQMGFAPIKIDLLTLNEINAIINNTKGKSLPYAEWNENINSVNLGTSNGHYEFGKLNNYAENDLTWLYGTTYWLRTAYDTYYNNMLFVDSSGGVCATETSVENKLVNCQYYLQMKSQLGAGIRPIVTIPNRLIYNIKTDINGKGTIDVIDNSLGGENISFKVTNSKGSKLKSIIIKSDKGNNIEFKEEELTKNEDGTLSISKNLFMMPYDNVTIKSIFVSQLKISTKTNGKGTIEVIDNAYEGDKVTFALTPKEGYSLKRITITTKNGKKIKYEEGSIIKNEDGTISINSFIMPDEDVLIEVEWSDDLIIKTIDRLIVNPETGDKIILVFILLIISINSLLFINNKKRKSITNK